LAPWKVLKDIETTLFVFTVPKEPIHVQLMLAVFNNNAAKVTLDQIIFVCPT
jgi:hypothetical protein